MTSFENLADFAANAEDCGNWHLPANSTSAEFDLAIELSDEEYTQMSRRINSVESRMCLMFIHHATQE